MWFWAGLEEGQEEARANSQKSEMAWHIPKAVGGYRGGMWLPMARDSTWSWGGVGASPGRTVCHTNDLVL